MATINSNALGVYTLNTAVTSPMEVLDTATAIASLTTADAPEGSAVGAPFLVVNSGVFVGVAEKANDTPATALVDLTDTLSLAGLATSSNLETQVSINETAARNGSGGSNTYIASGAMSWSVSVDGLLDISAGIGTAVSIMDAARAKQYMIVRFQMDESDTVNTYFAGQALIGTINVTGGVDDLATYSASLTGYGELYKGSNAE